MGCQPVCIELIERQLGARSPTERLQSQQTGERMGSRPSAAGGGGASAPALRPADHRSTSKTQLLPGDRALLPPSPCGLKVLSSPVEPNEPPQDLTPASRRQDHTTSPSASSAVVLHAANRSRRAIRPALASHAQRISSRVRDDRDTPLVWDETAAVIEVIWVGAEQENFFLWDSTAAITPDLARRAVDFFYTTSFVIAAENKNLARRANHRHDRIIAASARMSACARRVSQHMRRPRISLIRA